MHLKKLSILNFKNRQEAELEFFDGVNCFVGNNGVGKTNVLDAIYYLSFCKSFFNAVDSQNILHGEQMFVIQGEFNLLEDKVEHITCGLKKGQKKQFKRNKKEYQRLADHIGLLPLVMVSPSDIELIYDGSEVRRKFLDGIISQYNRQYLDNLIQYNRALQQRNTLLKQFAENRYVDKASLEVWDMQLCQFGQPVFEARKQFMDEFIPVFQHYYSLVSNDKELVQLDYSSQLINSTLEEVLVERQDKDCRTTYTTGGIHKDDITFKLSGYPLKKYGSQGQQKSYLIALRLAQYDFIKKAKGVKPIVLLDDIFDKLDQERVKSLMKLVSEHSFGQIFITDANKERIEDLFEDITQKPRIFTVNENKITS